MAHPPTRPACRTPRRIAALAAVGVTVTALVSACSAGQVAQTAVQVAPIEGANVTRGGVAIRAAEVATPPGGSYAAGGQAPMYAAIATDDTTSDTLVGVRAAGAAAVSFVALAAGASGSASASASASGSASTSASAAPSAAPSAAAINVRLAPASLTTFKDGGDYLQLQGLTRTLTPGMTISVTFTFARAGDVTFDVPVATPGTPGPRPTPSAAGE